MHVTIVDDDKDILELYHSWLSNEFDITLCDRPSMLFDIIQRNSTDIVLMDLHMPEMHGFEVYKKLKEQIPQLPVIFITSDLSEESEIAGIGLGAEDFIHKNITPEKLRARIRNKIQKNKVSQAVLTVGELNMDLNLGVLTIKGERINLTPIEFKFLATLARNSNNILSKEEIENTLWPGRHMLQQNLDTHLSNLRRKIHPYGSYIKTIKMRGYMIRPENLNQVTL